MTLKEFITKYNGKKVDFDGKYGGQCFDLYRQYVKEVLGFPQSAPTGTKGAKVLWTDFDKDPILVQHYTKVPNTPSFVPKAGDIAIWNGRMGGGYGHVAICTGKGDTKTFESFDQNWHKLSVCEIVTHTYSSFYGVMRPKGNMTYTKCEKKVKELTDEVKRKNKEIGNLQQQVNGLLQNIDILKIDKDKLELQVKKEQEQYHDLVQYLAITLNTTQRMPDIKSELEKLIRVEDMLVKCQISESSLQTKLDEIQHELGLILAELSKSTSYTVKSSKGVSKALGSFRKHILEKADKPKSVNDYTIIELIGVIVKKMGGKDVV